MDTVRVQHLLRRAADFLDGMRLTNDEDSFANSNALLAIHSAISYSDALRIGLGETSLSADDHSKGVEDLARMLKAVRVVDQSGLTQLQILLSKKSAVAYGSARIAAQDLKALATRAERFARWANRTGKQLKIEGWRHD